MKFNYKNRGFVVITLSAMLVVVGVANYQLSKKSALGVSEEFKAYEQAQLNKNSESDESKNNKEVDVVDSKSSESDVEEKVTETSKEIEEQLTSEANMQKSSYILDMKMTREKQRNDLAQELNEMINNPSTSEETRKEASEMKLKLVKDQDTELKIENLLSTKGFEDALVYISDGKVNVVVNEEGFGKEDAAKIFDLVAEQAEVEYDNIKLMNNKQE
ncbi:SpoIIIAH-like family protein [Romboutsia ilealis]|uniref:SpoIIIAH-like family protein n=1 Tax=Romboutsia faecis TaxID=2764597 RepID=A0ABR7JMA5_9FIRM|nr:SpoIIIAH-like family protein [Romboutsia faecis]MBC5996048.1 SpoIIIAH-like family protein [Romboutsia faecis]MRN23248.1 SpoIIIAH-like family protein [Romboutsia ilealis]